MESKEKKDKKDATAKKEKTVRNTRVNILVEQLQNALEDEYLKIETDRINLDKEKKNWVYTKEKLERIHFASKIKLDIGGKTFSTSLPTLTAIPGTFFSGMFSGNFRIAPDEDGTYFIDRDPLAFPYILNFLRGSQLDFKNMTKKELSALLEDSTYFAIEPLMTLLEEREQNNFTWDPNHKASFMVISGPTFSTTSSNNGIITTVEALRSGLNKIRMKINTESNWTYAGIATKGAQSEGAGPETHAQAWVFKSHNAHSFIRLFNSNNQFAEITNGSHFGQGDTICLTVDLNSGLMRIEVENKGYSLQYTIPGLSSTTTLWYFAVALNSQGHNMTILPPEAS